MTNLTQDEIKYIRAATQIKALEFERIYNKHKGQAFENKAVEISSEVCPDTLASLVLYRCFPPIESALNVSPFNSLMELGWRNRKIRSNLQTVNETNETISTIGLQVVGCELSTDYNGSMPKFFFKEAVWVDNIIYTCRFRMSVFEDCKLEDLDVKRNMILDACQFLNTTINTYKSLSLSLEEYAYSEGVLSFENSYLENCEIYLSNQTSMKRFECASSELKGCAIKLSDPYGGVSKTEAFDFGFVDSILVESSIDLSMSTLLSFKRLDLSVDASDLEVVTFGAVALNIGRKFKSDREPYRFENSHLKFLSLDHSDDDRQKIYIHDAKFIKCELVWEYRNAEIENLSMFANSQIADCSFEDCTITRLFFSMFIARVKFLHCELRDIDLLGNPNSLEFINCTLTKCYVSDRRFEAMGGMYIGNKATIKGETLKFRQLQNLESRESEFEACVFEDCDLSNADFTASYFVNCKFVNCQLYQTSFTNAMLRNCEFLECKMFKTTFPSVRFVSTIFKSNTLSDNLFDSTEFEDVRFEGVNYLYGERTFELLKAKPTSEIALDSSISLWLVDTTCDECGENKILPIEHSKATKQGGRAICWSCENEAEYDYDSYDSYDDDSWD